MENQEPPGVRRALLDYLGYWLRVWAFAFNRTWVFFGHPVHFRMLIPVIGFLVTFYVLRNLGEGEVAGEQALWALATVGSLGIVFAVVFVANLAYAPAAIDREQRDRIRALSPKLLLNLELDLSELYWAHILVTNHGQTDHFVAQLLDVEGESAVLPFSLKWRQSDEEAQQIISGQTRVLDFAHIELSSGWRMGEGSGSWCYLIICSTTARIAFGNRYVTYLDEETRMPKAEATDEELARPVRFLVEVRGAHSGAVGKGWASLGFKRKDEGLIPDGTMELCD